MKTDKKRNWMRGLLCGFGMLAAVAVTGCQVQVAGQTLPSPYYLKDDVQYHAPAPREFKLSREAAAMQAYDQGANLDMP